MRVSYIFLIIIVITLFANTVLAEWTLWVVPKSRSIDVGDSLEFVFGVTGGGYLDPHNLKVLLYSETDSILKPKGESTGEYDTYAILLNKDISKNVFQKINIDVPTVANQTILFEAEQQTPFRHMIVTPESPGDKKVKLVLSYKDADGIWRSTSDEFSYHARSFTEQYEKLGFVIAIAAALIGIWKHTLTGKEKGKRK